jgi:hypothetical protein
MGDRTSCGHDRRSDDYMFGGKQYIVVAIGSREHAAEFVAFSL